jgi:hypothetical protein
VKEERYFETEDLPVWSEVFLMATEISREEFDELRQLAVAA